MDQMKPDFHGVGESGGGEYGLGYGHVEALGQIKDDYGFPIWNTETKTFELDFTREDIITLTSQKFNNSPIDQLTNCPIDQLTLIDISHAYPHRSGQEARTIFMNNMIPTTFETLKLVNADFTKLDTQDMQQLIKIIRKNVKSELILIGCTFKNSQVNEMLENNNGLKFLEFSRDCSLVSDTDIRINPIWFDELQSLCIESTEEHLPSEDDEESFLKTDVLSETFVNQM